MVKLVDALLTVPLVGPVSVYEVAGAGSAPVITRFPLPVLATATKSPLPYVTPLHWLSAADVPIVQVIPSGLVMTWFPVPAVPDKATKSPLPYVTEYQLLSAAEV